MKVEFRESFAKDLKGVKEKGLLRRVREVIEAIESADSLTEISNLKKLKGGGNYFRVRGRRLSCGHGAGEWRNHLCPFLE